MMIHRGGSAFDETAAEYAGLAFSRVIKDAGLPRRNAMLAVHQFNFAALRIA